MKHPEGEDAQLVHRHVPEWRLDLRLVARDLFVHARAERGAVVVSMNGALLSGKASDLDLGEPCSMAACASAFLAAVCNCPRKGGKNAYGLTTSASVLCFVPLWRVLDASGVEDMTVNVVCDGGVEGVCKAVILA